MKHLLLTASALTLFAAPAQAQLLGGGGGVTGALNSSIGSTLRAPGETIRSTTRSTLRGNAATRGNQNVDRRSGSVAVDRSVDASLEPATSQLLATPAGDASGNASGSAAASGSGSANGQLLGTDTVMNAAKGRAGDARAAATNVRNLATPAVGRVHDRISGTAGQAVNTAGSTTGAIGGTASGAGMADGGILALAGSGAAQGNGAFSVAPGMPVELPSGAQLGTVRDIVATRSGQIRQIVVQTQDGLTTLPASGLSANGNALIAGEASGSASSEAPAEDADTE
ncbi:hypothetical protein [Allopontixanthobacter sp.]|uniref:hypothetical protein n=1 Tax=Allopontixanthobacter sp. TaxID=2906452 RepID=UPI002AB98956|nr:hypothetical protein [Allopontixanthobacter sp.]MDZ4308291.1 hypothetical protein [Allopontixanthobacter sp.]